MQIVQGTVVGWAQSRHGYDIIIGDPAHPEGWQTFHFKEMNPPMQARFERAKVDIAIEKKAKPVKFKIAAEGLAELVDLLEETP